MDYFRQCDGHIRNQRTDKCNLFWLQGLSFLIRLVGQLKKEYTEKLRSASSKYVKNMSLQESIVKAKYIKISKHLDDQWHVSVLNNKAVELLAEIGVNVEEDVQRLNTGTF